MFLKSSTLNLAVGDEYAATMRTAIPPSDVMTLVFSRVASLRSSVAMKRAFNKMAVPPWAPPRLGVTKILYPGMEKGSFSRRCVSVTKQMSTSWRRRKSANSSFCRRIPFALKLTTLVNLTVGDDLGDHFWKNLLQIHF